MKRFYLLLVALMGTYAVQAQGTIGYFKSGLTIATQKWNGIDNTLPLLANNTAIGLEFLGNQNSEKRFTSSFGIQLGYHQKGNAVRVRYMNPSNPNDFLRSKTQNQFHNASLFLFGKGTAQMGTNTSWYYLMGLRLDYTFKYAMYMNNIDNYVNKFNYGVSLGAGFNYNIPNTRLGIFVEAMISPDLSRQVYVPAGIPVQYQINGVTTPYPSQEMKVHNLVFELTVGFRLLPRVYEEVLDEEDIY